MGKPKPPVALLWDKFSFNPFTGKFHSRCGSPAATPVNKRKLPDDPIQGNVVGRKHSPSHQLSISGEHRYPYAVCVWAWVHGFWPEDVPLISGDSMTVDHIDHDPFNHRPWNLQILPMRQNIARERGRPRRRLAACLG